MFQHRMLNLSCNYMKCDPSAIIIHPKAGCVPPHFTQAVMFGNLHDLTFPPADGLGSSVLLR